MRTVTKLLLAGAGLAATAGAAAAASDHAHVLKVALPDGTIARIHYAGDVPPRLVLTPVADQLPAFFADDPFAALDRISGQMDRQMTALLHQAAMLSALTARADGDGSVPAGTALPPGAVRYSWTSFSNGAGAPCRQSVQVTSFGADQPARVVRQSSGDCSALSGRSPTPAVQQAKPAVPMLTPAAAQPAVPAKGPIV